MSKKPIIVFEGIEGSGKSHHIKVVSRFLDKNKIKYIKIREPGGSLNSEKIRKLILNKKLKLNNKTDLLLFFAARSENFEKIIKKNYKKKIILIDRFTDSTIAYQHYGMKLNINIIKMLNKFIIGNFNPDLIFLSTVNSKNLKKRLQRRSKLNRYDKFNLNFYQNVQKGYEKISKNKKKYIKINSNINSINDVKKIIIKRIDNII